jgi:hypothetical protein
MGLVDRIRNLGAPRSPAEADQLAVRQLAGRGADLTRPREVVHFLACTTEAAASAGAEAVRRLGYETRVERSAGSEGDWVVRATSVRVVDRHTVVAYRAAFERVAAELAVEYEGWEAAPKP